MFFWYVFCKKFGFTLLFVVALILAGSFFFFFDSIVDYN